MMLETTTNGINFSDTLVSSEGAAFILYPSKEHTQEQINQAKRELRNSRDVVSLKIADCGDLDYLYKSEIFRHKDTRSLKWYEIEQDEKQYVQKEKKAQP